MTRRRGSVVLLMVLAVVSLLATPLAGCGGDGHGGPSSGGTTAQAWPAPGTEPFSDGIQRALEQGIDVHVFVGEVPGITAAIVSPDGWWVGATGVDGRGERLRPDSALSYASITKTFVAAEVLLLADEGRIDLEAPISRYLDLPFDTAGATVRQVGTMTSAFPNLPLDLEAYLARHTRSEVTAADILRLSKDEPRAGLLGRPGNYNGLNYVVLGMLVERVTGEPLATVLRRDLLEPVGLTRVWTQTAERPEPPIALPVSPDPRGIVDDSGYLPSVAGASSGLGGAGMAGDALSLARWGYELYGGRVIAPDLVATMTDGDGAAEFGYGFGTMTSVIDGAEVVGHAGDYLGYTSILLVWVDARTSVALLTPARGDDPDPSHATWAESLHRAFEAAQARETG